MDTSQRRKEGRERNEGPLNKGGNGREMKENELTGVKIEKKTHYLEGGKKRKGKRRMYEPEEK